MIVTCTKLLFPFSPVSTVLNSGNVYYLEYSQVAEGIEEAIRPENKGWREQTNYKSLASAVTCWHATTKASDWLYSHVSHERDITAEPQVGGRDTEALAALEQQWWER